MECSAEGYLDNKQCVGECSEGKYPDKSTKTCKKCAQACYSCIGSTENDCLLCNYLKDYWKSSSNFGACVKIHCSEGTYLERNLRLNVSQCVECDEPCLTCKETGCIDCKTGYVRIPLTETDIVKCEKHIDGYVELANGKRKGNSYFILRNLWGWNQPGRS